MGIFDILKGFEKLVTELLLWLVFIPKTLFKIIADPNWVSSYVEAELKEKNEERFDSYISPILLFLVTSLVLFVIFNTLDFDTQNVATTERLIAELKGTQGTLAGLGFLSLPLLFALATELFRGTGLARNGIQRIFYIQCYYFSPLTLSFFAYILLTELLPGDDSLIGSSSLLLLVPVFIWFLIVEVKIIAQELNSKTHKTLKAIGVLSLCIMIFLVGGTFLLVLLSGSGKDANGVGIAEEIDHTLPGSGEFSISISGYGNSVGDYRLALLKAGEAQSTTEGLSQLNTEAMSTGDRSLNYGQFVDGRVTTNASSVWTFVGAEGDDIFVRVEPLDNELDAIVDVLDETRQSIIQDDGVSNFMVGSVGCFYIVAIGWAVILGFRSIFRKPDETKTQKEKAAE